MSAKTAVAVLLAVIGMLAIGGAWSSASAEPGNGGGNATGRPDDGTVGNGNPHANKPPTQNDGKGNGNKGHECDDNHGVGQGNPAHPNDCTTPTTVHHNGGGGGGGSTPTTAVTSNPSTPGAEPEAEVLGTNESVAPGSAVAGELARTGSTAETLGFMAVALLAFGGSAILFARREEQFGVLA